MKKPKFFNCYFDNEIMLNHLSDEQAGKLWKSLFAFVNRDEQSHIDDPVVALAFSVMTQQINRDFEKYDEKCEKNRTNVNSRKRALSNVNDGNQEKEEDKDKEEDNEEDKEDKDNDKEDRYIVEQDSTTHTPIIKDIVSYLNSKTGASYRATTKSTSRLIKARINEGFTLIDFKRVIDNRVNAWGKDKEMRQYLRPETLFSTKFESYLNCENVISTNSFEQTYNYDEEF